MNQARAPLKRSEILPETDLPDAEELLAWGRDRAKQVGVGPSPFLEQMGVASEAEYKKMRMAEGAVMVHAQIGYRDPEKTRRAFREIHQRLVRSGFGVDRYGICLDWSMGYPARKRADMPKGTGLILESPEDFAKLTQQAPVAPHFGDFVIGMPSAAENTEAALAAGSTAIGNLGQYFNFRLPYWTGDVETTSATVQAVALAAAQPVPILIHSNLDDGFAAQFHDAACALGAALIEGYIIEELMGGHLAHCYGHTYSEPLTRLAFQRALARVSKAPGTMIYGNTTVFGLEGVENYARLAGYLLVDIIAQRSRPSGHAIHPVPVTEAMRIPDVEEIIDAHLFCHRLIERAVTLEPLLNPDAADELSHRIERGGNEFKSSVLSGLAEAEIDIKNPFEMLLSLRRIGARRLEERFGPGERPSVPSERRKPLVKATTVAEIEEKAARCLEELDENRAQALRAGRLTACIATTDVHEYGKVLVEAVLRALGVDIVDAGVSTDPDVLAQAAREGDADFIALSTYNGVALDYLQRLRREMEERDLDIPIFIGGKLNQILDDRSGSLPVDVSGELESAGAIVCRRVEDMIERLVAIGEKKRPTEGAKDESHC